MFPVPCHAKTVTQLADTTDKFLARIRNIKTGEIKQHWDNKRDKTETIQRWI